MTSTDINNPRHNLLLARLPVDAFHRLLPDLESVHLSHYQVLHESGSKQDFAYFPTTAIVAMVGTTDESESVNVAMTGCDGLVGIAQVLDAQSSLIQAVVQTSGHAWRISTNALKREFFRNAALMTLCLRYALALLMHMGQLAACHRHHRLEQQFCRWLLLTLDRLPTNSIDSTQEVTAKLLGVRRQSVSEAAQALQDQGIITHQRGRITVVNRHQLEKRACSCYLKIKCEQDRLFTPFINPIHPQPALPSGESQREYADLYRRANQVEQALMYSDMAWFDINPIHQESVLHISPNFFQQLGYAGSSSPWTLTDWIARIHPDDVPLWSTARQAHFNGATPQYECEYRVRHKDGHWIWIAVRGKVAERDLFGKPTRMVGTLTDITPRKEATLALEMLARNDSLTGITNRHHFFELAENEFAISRRHNTPLSMLALDLDHFKSINDRYGHAGGDRVLQHFADTVRGILRSTDIFGRTGGEEFCVLLPHTDPEGAATLAQRILEAVRLNPARESKRTLPYTASLGVSHLTPKTSSFAMLLKSADKALYRAKRLGRDRMEIV